MAHLLDTKLFLDTVCDLLRQGQTHVSVPVTGGSMIPFLHSGDMVYLNPPPERLCRGDIVLYTRSNGDYVLHRIQKANADGSFLMVGDAQQTLERITDRGQIYGIVAQVRHKGNLLTPRSLRWWLYRHVWLWLRPFRRKLMALRGKVNIKK